MANSNVQVLQNFVVKDVNRIAFGIFDSLARTSPFINSIEGGTLPNISDTVQSITAASAFPATSLINPTFLDPSAICNYNPTVEDQPGFYNYTVNIGILRGIGPQICQWDSRTAFEGVYQAVENSLKDIITEIINADIKINCFLAQSGAKYICSSTQDLFANLSITPYLTNAPWPTVPNNVPDSPLTWQTLKQLVMVMRENYQALPFQTDSYEYYAQLITDIQTNEYLYTSAEVRSDIRSITTGSFKFGEETLKSYTWEGYRQIAIGIDQQPLRSSGFTTAPKNLVLINPIQKQAATEGQSQIPNPIYNSTTTAPYTISFLLFGQTFKRVVPQKFTGQSTVRFSEQLAFGELRWYYPQDSAYSWGDIGWHQYQIVRGYQPIRPHFCVAIMHKRCPLIFDNACSTTPV